jgi:hypothetical protein
LISRCPSSLTILRPRFISSDQSRPKQSQPEALLGPVQRNQLAENLKIHRGVADLKIHRGVADLKKVVGALIISIRAVNRRP